MAYVNSELKAKIVSALKKEFPGSAKDNGFKYTISVHHHSTIVCTISEGVFDFLGDYDKSNSDLAYVRVNKWHFTSHFTGKCLNIISKIDKCLNIDNYDRSDIQSDYFDVGHYVEINIGKWNKHYKLIK